MAPPIPVNEEIKPTTKPNTVFKNKFNLSFIFAVYLSTSTDVEWMIITGLNRVLFESSSLYLLFPLFYLKNKLKIWN